MLIKICGLTDVREAEYLNENRVDYAGIVLFCEKSRRNRSIESAKLILKALSPDIKRVAVMVSPTAQQVRQAAEAGFDHVQIHGEIKPGALDVLPVFKAFNVKDMGELPFYQSCPQIVGYVFDGCEPGSGKIFDWNLLKRLPRDGKLFILAGGLCAENVAEALTFVEPDGVDVSSGVERPDGSGKDAARIKAFVERVRNAERGEAALCTDC